MVHVDWTEMSEVELLRAYASIMAELRRRGVLRSSNNPVADWSEWLVARGLKLELRVGSAAGYDAVDGDGNRYQIKGRRLTPENKSTQLSAIRNLPDRPFDYLAAVIYNPDFSVAYAALVPHEVVLETARYSEHTNAYNLHMRRVLLEDSRVVDITEKLRR